MDTLLSKPVVRERLELSPFVARLAEGLADDADIKMRCHAMLVALSALPAGQPRRVPLPPNFIHILSHFPGHCCLWLVDAP